MGKIITPPSPRFQSWTPVPSFATPGDFACTFTTQIGELYYYDRWVEALFTLVMATFTFTTASGNFQISGLPVTSKTVAGQAWRDALGIFGGITKANYTQFATSIASNSSLILITASGSAQTLDTVKAADMPSGSTKTIIGKVGFPLP